MGRWYCWRLKDARKATPISRLAALPDHKAASVQSSANCAELFATSRGGVTCRDGNRRVRADAIGPTGIIIAIKDHITAMIGFVESSNMIQDLDQECVHPCAAISAILYVLAICDSGIFDQLALRRRGNDHLLRDIIISGKYEMINS